MPSTERRLELKEKTSMAQTVWQLAVYAKGLRNILSKSGTFPLGHPVFGTKESNHKGHNTLKNTFEYNHFSLSRQNPHYVL